MPWHISIILGFVFIGIGFASWMDVHIVEKHNTKTITILVNSKGERIQEIHGNYIFEEFKLIENEKKQ
jgi:hypothetical protein